MSTLTCRSVGSPPASSAGVPHQKRKTNDDASRSLVGALHVYVQRDVVNPVSTISVEPWASRTIQITTGPAVSSQVPWNVMVPPSPTTVPDAVTVGGPGSGTVVVVDVVVVDVVMAVVVVVVAVVAGGMDVSDGSGAGSLVGGEVVAIDVWTESVLFVAAS